ncbi:MAG TPA: mismatch-specific DNA-glycosylase [Dehalococcoidia bacterium]|nr:mismatch-specific DNA-glycosylase [Dehalococcoidia bacterium]
MKGQRGPATFPTVRAEVLAGPRARLDRSCVLRPLPSYLRPGLDLVLCGCNPGLFSAAVGHYFARPGNAFWPLLAEAGITPRLFRPDEDAALLELGVGLTDIVARPSAGTGDVSAAEWRAGGAAVAGRLREFRPAAVCFVGDTAYRAFAGRPRDRWGRQAGDWEGTAVFVAPSTSGRVVRLAAERRAAFLEVGAWLRARRESAVMPLSGDSP